VKVSTKNLRRHEVTIYVVSAYLRRWSSSSLIFLRWVTGTSSSETWWRTDSRLGKRDVETDVVGVSLFVVLSAFIDVLLTVLQHSIDEPASHGRDGFRGTEPAAQASAHPPALQVNEKQDIVSNQPLRTAGCRR
jgi:hypothetical protein